MNNKLLFKIIWDSSKVIKMFHSKKNGALRLNTYDLYEDRRGFYIQGKSERVYLTEENCVNLLDT